MIKLETHCHSKGGSGCAHAPAEVAIEAYKMAGYGGIVITNHIHPEPYREYRGGNHKEKMDFWFSLADDFVSKGKQAGLKIFVGAEACVYRADGKFTECMLYGFTREFIYDHKPLFYYTQEELFRLSEKHNIFMYQTHPFRERIGVGKPEFMHGAEEFNGHVGHHNGNDLAKEFCAEHSLKRLSGTDYHDEGQAITAGIYLPDEINDEFQLRDYLFNNQPTLIKDIALYDKEFRG